MRNLFTLFFALNSLFLMAQQRIDDSFPFQSDPSKDYSIYVPSGYDANTPHRLMIGLHPYNTSRWDAKSWCDTLTNFAEMNNLLLACPDGGSDGKVDDAIDTAFTSALLDSMKNWYNVDVDKVYLMGFSWGGKTTYTYGLRHASWFGGFIPIGSAISSSSEYSSIASNANNKPFYLVHGSMDSPTTRYTNPKTAMENGGGIVEGLLMSGVGHTIDFPNRNQILSTAFQWVDSVNCLLLSNEQGMNDVKSPLQVYPTLLQQGDPIHIGQVESNDWKLRMLDVSGRLVKEEQLLGASISTRHLPAGMYFLNLENGPKKHTVKVLLY